MDEYATDHIKNSRAKQHIKAQRTADRLFLGACLSISSDDLSFVDSGTEWLKVEKKTTKNKLTITITAAIP